MERAGKDAAMRLNAGWVFGAVPGIHHLGAMPFKGGSRLRVEAGVCPNCSEVVFRLRDGLEKALELLRCAGIDVARVPKAEFWGGDFGIPENEGCEEVQIVDAENPLLPDTRWQAALWLVPEWDGGPAIVGHQHCRHQLFPTMLKVEKVLRGRWRGHDGGSTEEYRAWKARHRTRSAVRKFVREMEEERG